MVEYQFDKAMEALGKDKAMTQWPKMLEMLQALETKYSAQINEVTEVEWDIVAVAEASA